MPRLPQQPLGPRLRYQGSVKLIPRLAQGQTPVSMTGRQQHRSRQGHRQQHQCQHRGERVPFRPTPQPPDPADRSGTDRIPSKPAPQVVRQGPRAGISRPRRFLQRLLTDHRQIARHPGCLHRHRNHRLVHNGTQQPADILVPGMRRRPGQAFIQNRTQPVHVARHRGLRRRPARHLGRHILRRPEKRTGPRQPAPAIRRQLGQSEIADVRPAITIKQKIPGLQVTMKHAALVRKMHRLRQTGHQLSRTPRIHATRLEAAGQRSARHQLHRKKRHSAAATHLIHRQNPRMIQGHHRPRFNPEPLQHLRILRKTRQQHLQGHFTLRHRLSRTVHNPHTAARQLAQQFIPGHLRAFVSRRRIPHPKKTGSTDGITPTAGQRRPAQTAYRTGRRRRGMERL